VSVVVTYTLIINEAPYGKERAYTAIRFAWTCDVEGHKVRIFLLENGVYLAKKNQSPAENVAPNTGKNLAELIEGGAEVKACGVCMQARGLSESDLISGVKSATMHELVEWTTTSDKVIVF
jgi:tRNA 2-thiouridine synthesizing protein D